jgi:aconitate hydratase
MLTPPKPKEERGEIKKGPNISSMPDFDGLKDFEVPVLLKMGDDISTDEILRAGTEVLPYRSNIPEISKFTLDVVDKNFYQRAMDAKDESGGHVVVAGENYAQGSSREHAAIAPRYLGQRAVIAKSYARIGWQNLVNFGIPPFEFASDSDYEDIDQGDILKVENIRGSIEIGNTAKLINVTKGNEYEVKHTLSNRQREAVLDGGVINTFKKKKAS